MEQRISRLREQIPPQLDAILITSDINRLFYTGMASTAGTLLVTPKGAVFIIDFRYYELASQAIKGCRVLLQEKLMDQLNQLLEEFGVKTLGLESGYMTLEQACRFQKELHCQVSFDSAANDVILRQRRIKSPEEIGLIRKAQAISEKAFDHILGFIRPGLTELEIATELEFACRRLGGQDRSFDPIVVAGPNSSRPHGHPGSRPVQEGDFLTMDFGATVEGYHADMTRTVAVGRPTEEMEKVYSLVLRAKQEAEKAIRLGMRCADVDKVARDLIDAGGYPKCFGHGLGHGVGLEIHEAPGFNQTSQELVEPGIVMSVEPGIYLEGRFGVRIEDLVAITEAGVENLNTSPTGLLVL